MANVGEEVLVIVWSFSAGAVERTGVGGALLNHANIGPQTSAEEEEAGEVRKRMRGRRDENTGRKSPQKGRSQEDYPGGM